VRLSMVLIFSMLTSVCLSANDTLLRYQNRYSLCREKSDVKIASCLLNGNLDFSRFRGEKRAYRHIDLQSISKAYKEGRVYEFTMSHMPKTRRYEALLGYLDHLYNIRESYVTPRFLGDEAEDTIRMKRIFNLLYNAGLKVTPERDHAFEEALLEFQRRNGR